MCSFSCEEKRSQLQLLDYLLSLTVLMNTDLKNEPVVLWLGPAWSRGLCCACCWKNTSSTWKTWVNRREYKVILSAQTRSSEYLGMVDLGEIVTEWIFRRWGFSLSLRTTSSQSAFLNVFHLWNVTTNISPLGLTHGSISWNNIQGGFIWEHVKMNLINLVPCNLTQSLVLFIVQSDYNTKRIVILVLYF